MKKVEKSNYPTYFRLNNRFHTYLTNEVKMEKAFCFIVTENNKILDHFVVCDNFNDNKNYLVLENKSLLEDKELMKQIFDKLELEYSSITISIESNNKKQIDDALECGFTTEKEIKQSSHKYTILKKEL